MVRRRSRRPASGRRPRARGRAGEAVEGPARGRPPRPCTRGRRAARPARRPGSGRSDRRRRGDRRLRWAVPSRPRSRARRPRASPGSARRGQERAVRDRLRREARTRRRARLVVGRAARADQRCVAGRIGSGPSVSARRGAPGRTPVRSSTSVGAPSAFRSRLPSGSSRRLDARAPRDAERSVQVAPPSVVNAARPRASTRAARRARRAARRPRRLPGMATRWQARERRGDRPRSRPTACEAGTSRATGARRPSRRRPRSGDQIAEEALRPVDAVLRPQDEPSAEPIRQRGQAAQPIRVARRRDHHAPVHHHAHAVHDRRLGAGQRRSLSRLGEDRAEPVRVEVARRRGSRSASRAIGAARSEARPRRRRAVIPAHAARKGIDHSQRPRTPGPPAAHGPPDPREQRRARHTFCRTSASRRPRAAPASRPPPAPASE